MKPSTGLALAAALAAAAGAAYTGLPAAATPPPPADRPPLPPIVLDPGVKLPTPADLTPPAAVKLPTAPQQAAPPVAEKERPIINQGRKAGQYFERPAPPDAPPKVELPPLPPVAPAPLPVPQPIVPAAKADPTKLPAVPPPPVAAPLPLPAGPPPIAAPKLPAVPPPPTPLPAPPVLTPPTPLPAVPPPVSAPKADPLPAPRPAAPLPVVPPPDAPAKANPLPPPTPVTPTVGPSIGSVVVLQDGKVVEGHVSRSGDKVVVRRGVIDQPFPNEQVKYITPDKDAAYRAALADTKADDPAARLRLARWCMYNGMRENALTEAKEAARLEPANRAATELARTLEESLRLYPTAGAARPATPPPAPGLPAVPPPVPTPAPVVTVPDAALPPEAVVAFGPRVQPVVMNQCAACHAQPAHASRFKLVPVASNEVNAAATRQNLQAAVAQVKKGEPGASPLLVKALTAHGGLPTPALADRDAPAFRTLQAWVYLVAGEVTPPTAVAPPTPTPTPSPALPPPPPYADVRPMLPPPPLPAPDARPALPPAPPAIPPAVGNAPLPVVPVIPPATSSWPAVPPVTPAGGFGQSAPPVTPTGPAQDEFDPADFNRTPRR